MGISSVSTNLLRWMLDIYNHLSTLRLTRLPSSTSTARAMSFWAGVARLRTVDSCRRAMTYRAPRKSCMHTVQTTNGSNQYRRQVMCEICRGHLGIWWPHRMSRTMMEHLIGDDLDLEIPRGHPELVGLRQEVRQMRTEIEDLKGHEKELAEEVDKLKDESARREKELEDEVKQLKNKNASLEKELEEEEKTIVELRKAGKPSPAHPEERASEASSSSQVLPKAPPWAQTVKLGPCPSS